MLHKTPAEIIEGHTSYELQEWKAYLKAKEADRQQAEDKAKVRNKVKGRRS